MLEYLCLVTTPSYAPGAVCLTQSLALCGSAAVLRVIATTREAEAALLREFATICTPSVNNKNYLVEFRAIELPGEEDGAATHGAKGATLSVDAPRRVLFEDGKPFVLLDADLIAVQNPDAYLLLDGGDSLLLRATANFRIKRQSFGTAEGNFNAGVMVVPDPNPEDGRRLASLVANATSEDTEELLLNQVFKARWTELPHGLNVPKRVMHHAPLVWNELIAKRELVFVHYMGAKPWISDMGKRVGADWESERPSYLELEKLWWKIRREEIDASEHGLLDHVPLSREGL